MPGEHRRKPRAARGAGRPDRSARTERRGEGFARRPAASIYVDADACPVKDEVVAVAERHGLVVTFVSNGGLRPSRDPMIRNVVVPKGPTPRDDWIVENTKANDIVVTADIPLAARTVALGAHVIGMTGKPFTSETIGMAVAMRDLKQHLRETGESKGLQFELHTARPFRLPRRARPGGPAGVESGGRLIWRCRIRAV